MKKRIAINGVCGRMGRRLVALAAVDPELEIVGALEDANNPDLGRDAGELAGVERLGVAIGSTLTPTERIDVIIDFSQPEGTMAVLPICIDRQIPLLVATTGHSPAQRREIHEAAHETAIMIAANTSLAVNVLAVLVRRAGELLLSRGFDVEIIERHHRLKKDAPSGTALHLASLLRDAEGDLPQRHGRTGHTGERPPREIGVHAVRTGDNVGEHSVIFGGIGEALELTQRATSRDCYAKGALQAAKFLVGRSAGSYSMADVLGL